MNLYRFIHFAGFILDCFIFSQKLDLRIRISFNVFLNQFNRIFFMSYMYMYTFIMLLQIYIFRLD